MPTPIYGLQGTEGFANNRFKNVRRKVFYFYPNGNAPLLAILSMLPEESTNDPEFSIFEDRVPQLSTTTNASSNVVFHDAGTTGSATPGAIKTSNFAIAVGDVLCLRIQTRQQMRQDVIVQVQGIPLAAGGSVDARFRVIEAFTNASVDYIRVVAMEAVATQDYDGYTTNVTVLPIGSAAEQGQTGSGKHAYRLPVQIWNYCQIFRSHFTFTGTEMSTAADFDESGTYKDKAKKASFDHFREMEFGFIFGERTKTVDLTTNLPRYTTGGILWFLRLWEAGATYGNAGASLDNDDEKRIIENTSGTVTREQFEEQFDKVFRFTSANNNEKLALCGNGALRTIQNLLRGEYTFNANQLLTGKVGMNVVSIEMTFGTVHFKTHPQFTHEPTLRYNMLVTDVADYVYRYLEGRDSEILKHRQPNDADYRQDEWLGECGLELRQPEANMYYKNLQTAVIS